MLPEHLSTLELLLILQLRGMTMNVLEQFAITVMLSLIQMVIKNPETAAKVKGQLLGLADDIYEAYGTVPPTHS